MQQYSSVFYLLQTQISIKVPPHVSGCANINSHVNLTRNPYEIFVVALYATGASRNAIQQFTYGEQNEVNQPKTNQFC